MPGNKNKPGKQDDDKVDKNHPGEVEYLHKQFPNKTHQQIRDAIDLKDPYRKNIVAHLKSS